MVSRKMINAKWLLLIFASLSIFLYFFQDAYANRFYPGIKVGGEYLGGMSYEQALVKFAAKADYILENGLTLIFKREKGEREVKIPVATSGFTSDTLVEYFSLSDWERVLEEAYRWGRQGSVFQRAKEQILIIFGKKFEWPMVVYEDSIASLLSAETKPFLKEPQKAQFTVDKNGEVSIMDAKLGETVEWSDVISRIHASLADLEGGPLVFKTRVEKSPITTEKLSEHLPLAKGIAESANINFHYRNRKWKVSGKTLVTWLTIKDNNEIGVDSKKLEAYLTKNVAPLINNPPQNSRFEIQEGKLVEIFPGRSGQVVDIKKTIDRIEALIPRVQKSYALTGNIISALAAVSAEINFNSISNTIDVLIETIEAEPQVTLKTINQYQIKDLVGYARTGFKGSSADRRHNIAVGVSKLTGILISPGQEFSTVITMGPPTESEGFVKEFVIKKDRTVKELGGGLCQIATTLFRMALNAGLPITERVNHKYVISYYGPGLDATIYGPHPDLRFINDTGNYLLLQGKVEGDEVIFELYGVNDGRKVKISEPRLYNEVPVPETRYIKTEDLSEGQTQCTSTTHKGITSDVAYTVIYADGSVNEANFHSVYEAWPRVCLVGIRGAAASAPILNQE